jgi:hypothetical protein
LNDANGDGVTGHTKIVMTAFEYLLPPELNAQGTIACMTAAELTTLRQRRSANAHIGNDFGGID